MATTVGEDCILGVSVALNADEENLTEAHQHFKDEAQALKAIFVPETVNADGWSATQRAWLWIGAWHVIALARAGRLDESRETCARMAGIIVCDQQIHEVYAPNGKPLSNFWYTSESPLTWNAGMIVYAYSVLDQLMKSKTGIVSIVDDEKE